MAGCVFLGVLLVNMYRLHTAVITPRGDGSPSATELRRSLEEVAELAEHGGRSIEGVGFCTKRRGMYGLNPDENNVHGNFMLLSGPFETVAEQNAEITCSMDF